MLVSSLLSKGGQLMLSKPDAGQAIIGLEKTLFHLRGR